jgi:hypothetical protein
MGKNLSFTAILFPQSGREPLNSDLSQIGAQTPGAIFLYKINKFKKCHNCKDRATARGTVVA